MTSGLMHWLQHFVDDTVHLFHHPPTNSDVVAGSMSEFAAHTPHDFGALSWWHQLELC
jgi:hypothetical protein